MIWQILDFLVAIPRIAGIVEKAVSAIVSWYLSKQKNETLSQIADAAALAAKANSKEERLEAVKKWKEVLSRPRVS